MYELKTTSLIIYRLEDSFMRVVRFCNVSVKLSDLINYFDKLKYYKKYKSNKLFFLETFSYAILLLK